MQATVILWTIPSYEVLSRKVLSTTNRSFHPVIQWPVVDNLFFRYTSYDLEGLFYLNVAPLQETFVLAILGIAELVAKHKCVSYICA